MITFRQASNACVLLLALVAAAVLWWRWPEETVSGVWSGTANGETIELAFLQQLDGVLHGHGVIVSGATHVVAATGRVEGTRAGDRLALNLSAEKQVFTLLVQLDKTGTLLGRYFKPGATSAQITLIRK